MAGTISLSLQQQFSASTGRLLSGGRVYFYASGSLTPQSAYQEAGLSTTHPNPIILGADGRVPFLWFADGTIRVRLTDSGGVVQFDTDNIAVVGSSGGGGVDTTDANAIASTGDIKWRMQTGTLTGWVRINGRTVGSATSGASERANADVETLFSYLWNNFSNTICPVSTGRGASAAADWSANKTITLPDMRGRAPFGVDDMGNSAASRITSATYSTPLVPGTGGGAERHTLTEAELAVHDHSVTDPGHDHDVPVIENTAGTANLLAGSHNYNAGGSTSAATTGITIQEAGGGQAHNNMPPGLVGTWYMRL